MTEYRLERSNKPFVNAKITGSYHAPKRTWKLFGTFPMPVHPSAISSGADPAQNMLVGKVGQQVRLVLNDQVLALYEWTHVLENPGDAEASNSVMGWKLISSSPVSGIPERNHATVPGELLLPYVPSFGLEGTGVQFPNRDYLNASGPVYPKDEEDK